MGAADADDRRHGSKASTKTLALSPNMNPYLAITRLSTTSNDQDAFNANDRTTTPTKYANAITLKKRRLHIAHRRLLRLRLARMFANHSKTTTAAKATLGEKNAFAAGEPNTNKVGHPAGTTHDEAATKGMSETVPSHCINERMPTRKAPVRRGRTDEPTIDEATMPTTATSESDAHTPQASGAYPLSSSHAPRGAASVWPTSWYEDEGNEDAWTAARLPA